MASVTEKELEALFINNTDFDYLEHRLAVFCPFEAIGMVRQEVRHGAFLSYIFDPARPHGFGNSCLRALMHAITTMAVPNHFDMTPLDAYLMADDAVTVGPWRNIDILIRYPRNRIIIAIELKIDADEHGSQLQRYYQRVKEEWSEQEGWLHGFVFLTKNGDEPSQKNWIALELSQLISEFEKILQQGNGIEPARQLLAAYISMLRRHHLTEDHLEELANRLWAKHRTALEYLADRRPDDASGVAGLLLEQANDIAKQISARTGLDIVVDDPSGMSIIRFGISSWDRLPNLMGSDKWTSSGRLILAELSIKRNSTRALIVLGRGDQEGRKQIFDHLIQGGIVAQASKLSPEFKRLFSERLPDVSEDPDTDIENQARKIRDQFVEKISLALKRYDSVLCHMK